VHIGMARDTFLACIGKNKSRMTHFAIGHFMLTLHCKIRCTVIEPQTVKVDFPAACSMTGVTSHGKIFTMRGLRMQCQNDKAKQCCNPNSICNRFNQSATYLKSETSVFIIQ